MQLGCLFAHSCACWVKPLHGCVWILVLVDKLAVCCLLWVCVCWGQGLGSPSSPQGNSLLQAKAARAAAQRSALSRPPLAAGPPSPGFSPSTADGAAHSGFGGQGQDEGVGSGQPIRVQAPVAALVADAGLAAQSSPQGSDLLSIKAARAARAAQGKKSALGRQ
jgi:hypothetical protein